MLQTIRDHAQGWIAWVIVGLIIMTFALFGIDQYARGDKLVTVAEVNGEDIDANTFLTLYNRQKVRLQEQFGDLYEQVVKDEELRNQVLDALVETEVIRQWSSNNSMMISDQQLAATIHGAEVFQQDGKFSDKVYEEILLRNGLNVARFEFEQRQYLLEAQYRELTTGSNFTTAFELNQLASLQGQQRDVNYLRIDQRPFLKTVQITDEQVAQHYESQKALYVEPEQVTIDYVELSQAEIAKTIPVTDEVIANYYKDNQSAFTQPEKRQAKHILISVEAKTPEADAQALVTIAEVQAKLKAGESFEELAKTYSKDPGSASLGGDLGFFEQGMMVPEFDEAVFAMQADQVSEPVQTEFGYHLIKVVAIEPAKAQPLDEIKAEVTAQYQMQMAEKQYFDALEKLNILAYEQPDSLEPAAQSAGIKVMTSDKFGRDGGPGDILSNPKVANLAFSDEILKSRQNSTVIELAPNRSVFIRLNEHFPSKQKALEEVAGAIKEQLTREAAIDEAALLAASVMEKINKGENPETLAKDGIEWSVVGWVGRDTQKLLPQLVADIFKAVKPAQGQSTWRTLQLSTGDTVLIQVKGVKTEAITEEQKAPLMTAYSDLMSGAELDARLNALLAKAEVVKKPEYLTVK